jgi:hypothetical protein
MIEMILSHSIRTEVYTIDSRLFITQEQTGCVELTKQQAYELYVAINEIYKFVPSKPKEAE